MAEFEVRHVEGMRQIRARIEDESMRAASGALSHMDGRIAMSAPIPGPFDLMRSMISREAKVRPRYEGTGEIHLEPTLGGYHVFEARDLRWILEPGVFWAAEGEVRLGLTREPFLTSLLAGDGLIRIQTTVQGDGKVVIRAPGPVDEIEIDGEMYAQGNIVLGRTDGLRYRSRRPIGWFRSWLAGEPRLRHFAGKGRALVCWTPYWNQYIHEMMTGEREPTL